MRREKILSLQVLRAFACIVIILGHANICSDLARGGVSIFFVLSGFLFMYNYFDSNMQLEVKALILFSLKRIGKLYPLYICTIIALIPLNHLPGQSPVFVIKNSLIHVFLLQSLFKDDNIIYGFNGVAWYLSCVMFIYALVPIFLMLIKRSKSKLIIISECFALVAFQILLGNLTALNVYISPLSRFVDVFVGCCVGYFFVCRINNNDGDKNYRYTLYEIVAIVFTVFSNYLCLNHRISGVYGILPSTVILIYVFALNKGYISKILTNSFLVYLGNVSGYAYLIHIVVIRWLIVFAKHILHIELHKFVLFIFSFALTIICSKLWKEIEIFLKKDFTYINK